MQLDRFVTSVAKLCARNRLGVATGREALLGADTYGLDAIVLGRFEAPLGRVDITCLQQQPAEHRGDFVLFELTTATLPERRSGSGDTWWIWFLGSRVAVTLLLTGYSQQFIHWRAVP